MCDAEHLHARRALPSEQAVVIEWDLDAIALGGYPHFMLKEICEQAETVRSTLRGRLLAEEGTARLNGLNLTPAQCSRIRRIVIVACGTSWHAGLVGRQVLEELVEIPVIGPFMRMVPIHPVDREAADLDAFQTAIRILESGNILGIFPEGTRSVDGTLRQVREGAGVLALHSGATIMPVAIVDSDLAWPKGHLLPRFRTLFDGVEVE